MLGCEPKRRRKRLTCPDGHEQVGVRFLIGSLFGVTNVWEVVVKLETQELYRELKQRSHFVSAEP